MCPQVSRFSHELRIRLWRDYLRVESEEDVNLEDPLSDELFFKMRNMARSNTEIYSTVFPLIPDNVHSLEGNLRDQILQILRQFRCPETQR